GHEHRDEEESEDAQRDDIDQYREPHGGHDADDVDPDKDDVGHDEPRHRAVPPWVTGEVQQGLGDVVHQDAHGVHHTSGGRQDFHVLGQTRDESAPRANRRSG